MIKEACELKRQISIFVSIVLLLAIVGLSSWATEDPAVLKSIRYQKMAKGLDVTILLEGTFVYQAFTLADPNRLAIDLSPVDKIEADLYSEVNALGVTSLRTGEFAPQIVRIVVDFSGQLLPYEIKKIEGGILLRLSTEAPPAAKPVAEARKVAPPAREKRPERVAQEVQKEGFYNTMVGLSIASYKIPDKRFEEVYGPDASPIYGLSLSRTLVSLGGFQFDLSAEARLYNKTGAATVSQEETKLTMFPVISIAPRLLFQTKYVMFFVGGGIDFYHYKEKSLLLPVDLYPDQSISNSVTGSHFQAGVYIIPPTIEFLRIKLYYKFTKVSALENDINVDLGGTEYGVGLSFGFNFLNSALYNR